MEDDGKRHEAAEAPATSDAGASVAHVAAPEACVTRRFAALPASGHLTYLATAMAVALLLLPAAPAHARDAHGAIAVGQTAYGDSVAYGFSWNHAAKDKAIEAAMNACRAAGGTTCTELAWFRNGCGALALDRYGGAQGRSAMSRDRAEARAMKSCETAGGSGCALVEAACASPGGEPGTWSGSESVDRPPEEEPGAAAGERAERPAGADDAPEEALTREERVLVQRGLAALGYRPGPADGMFGPRSRSAIREWQKAKGIEATGTLTREEAAALAAAGAPGQAASPDPAGESRRSQNRVLHFPEAGPKCEGMPEGSSCWRALAGKPGCSVFEDSYSPGATVAWSGGCDGDTAHGQGTLSYGFSDGDSAELTGELVSGKASGHWVERYSWADTVWQGPYVDGEKHGRWIGRTPDGDVFEGPYVNGERHGHWVYDSPDWTHEQGPYVDGRKHGHWIERWSDGSSVSEGAYVDGKRHGRWIERWRDGDVEERRYVHGEMVEKRTGGN